MIDKLNSEVKVKLGASPVHGVGCFAIRLIKKGEKMFCREKTRAWYKFRKEDFDKLYPEVRDLILQRWPIAIEGAWFMHPNSDAYLISFMNELEGSENYDELSDMASKDIKTGEEVFSNYNRFRELLLKIK